ncbi:MAG: NAD(P)/FAD-dependent oxidoreductase [Acidimicrobiia bacterium]|nr:NAD(P)/FAD-dependent oxidoreductase [Acidimicrobiia bacterium]
MTDVIIIGGGLNGLVAANVLAKKQFSVLVLEREDQVGGAAVTGTSALGVKLPTLSHALGPVSADVCRTLKLDRAGIEFMMPDPVLTTFGTKGEVITFHRDHILSAASIARVSSADAAKWQSFGVTLQRLAHVLKELNRHQPPSVDSPASADLWRLLKVGRHARALGSRELARLGRYVPICVADLVSEWFESDLVQAAVAARAIFGHHMGPWSAGTGALLLQRLAEDPMPVGGGATIEGGPGAFSAALASMATQSNVTIRTGVKVARVLTHAGAAAGVVLESGEEIQAHVVVGAIDPKQLLLSLVDPTDLPPTFRQRVQQIRARGVTAKINLTLNGVPAFTALHGDDLPLRGRMLIAPSIDYLERAHDATKYGGMAASPWVELSCPGISDDTLVAQGHHPLSMYVHGVANNSGITREEVLKRALAVIAPHAPALESQIVEREVLTPADLEARWGYSGGHFFHGEGALDQWWVSRPLLGWADRYASPIEGLFLASAGTHPGGGLTGQSGLNAARVISGVLGRRRR